MINEVISYFEKEDKIQDNFSWNEYTLEELGLPPADQILKGVKKVESIVGLAKVLLDSVWVAPNKTKVSLLLKLGKYTVLVPLFALPPRSG